MQVGTPFQYFTVAAESLSDGKNSSFYGTSHLFVSVHSYGWISS